MRYFLCLFSVTILYRVALMKMAARLARQLRKRPAKGSGSEHSSKKVKVRSRKKAAELDEKILSETEYYIKDGLRYVKPYYFTFTTHTKGRWVGSTIYDVFCREFQAESPQYYERAIAAGKVSVNGKVAEMSTVLHDNDLLTHRVHRHEPPVTAQPLTLLHMDQQLVVVDKPASIPIHPCGRYRHNTVLFLLRKEHNLKELHTVHRLDRLTSGLLILARTIQRAQQLDAEIREHRVTKEYVCRVQGEFPCTPVACDEPILVFSHKLGLSRVDPEGKPCSTLFTRLSYNGETSVVKCEPKTGRMHQIRVHLRWLGHPIVNDPLYNHPVWKHHGDRKEGEGQPSPPRYNYEKIITEIARSKFVDTVSGTSPEAGASLSLTVGEGDDGRREIVEREGGREEEGRGDGGREEEGRGEGGREEEGRGEGGREENGRGEGGREKEGGGGGSDKGREEGCGGDEDGTSEIGQEKETRKECLPEGEKTVPSDIIYDPDCTECQRVRPTPSPDELFLYLHALSYKGEGWAFATPLPPWAAADWKRTSVTK